MNSPFCDTEDPAELSLHPNWAHMDPMALSMAAAWGGWCSRNRLNVIGSNIDGKHANYASRMKLFPCLGIDHNAAIAEHEEAGRFLPLRQIKNQDELKNVIADISALLHLNDEPDGLAAVQYCVSELIRNVLEHSGSMEGAYICAQRYLKKHPRVSIAVADCGWGIGEHLGQVYPAAKRDPVAALRLAMRPGITGAQRGTYGAPDNAGAGLFMTRAIAKATGGYFVLISGGAAFRLKRTSRKAKRTLYWDPFEDKKHDVFELVHPWQGTVAAVEIGTEQIADFPAFFQWIRKQLPSRREVAAQIKFT